MSFSDETLMLVNQQFKKMHPGDTTQFTEYQKTTKNGCEYIVASSKTIEHLKQNACYTVLGNDDKRVSSSIFILSPQDPQNDGTMIQITGQPASKYDVGIRKSNNPAGCSIRIFNKGIPYGILNVDYYMDVSDLSNVGKILNGFINQTQTINVPNKQSLKTTRTRYSLYAQRTKAALLLVTDPATLDKLPTKIKKNPNPLSGFPHHLIHQKNRL